MFWIADVFIGTNSQDWTFRASAGRGWKWLSDRLYAMHQRRSARRSLNQLNDHLLRDIGISRTDIEAYLSKPGFQPSRLAETREFRRAVDVERVSTRAVTNVESAAFTEGDTIERDDADDSNGTARKAA